MKAGNLDIWVYADWVGLKTDIQFKYNLESLLNLNHIKNLFPAFSVVNNKLFIFLF
jgi:hypothetical protein